MKTEHRIVYENAKKMSVISSESVDLVVTSPPYPMIEMWDDLFTALNPEIDSALKRSKPFHAFELMHQELDGIWQEVLRILKRGGIACINIGDATRTIDSNFTLYPNHARILSAFLKIGFSPLPIIIWRKQTNAPNKFMGSGMFPPGAYVTLEHEYILVLRKGPKREFSGADKLLRHESTYFWEERNMWFSDVWFDLKGTTQKVKNDHTRLRSGAFPFELPYRLINMFSIKGDMVVDPFLGLGTTTLAAMASARNSMGYEIDRHFHKALHPRLEQIVTLSNTRIEERLNNHIMFVRNRIEAKGALKHTNVHYEFPVITKQESKLLINDLIALEKKDGMFEMRYSQHPQEKIRQRWKEIHAAL